MKHLKTTVIVAALVLAAAPAAAQTDSAAAGQQAEREKLERELDAREHEVQRKLAEAEARMAEAARQIAELTTERLPQINRLQSRIEFIDDGRPRLGVTVGGNEKGPVEGARIVGVTLTNASQDSAVSDYYG